MSTVYSSKKQLISNLKQQLATRPERAVTALKRIYGFQTVEEQNTELTLHHNHRGFDAVDSKILTSLAKQLEAKGSLSQNQISLLLRYMPKYASQLIEYSLRTGKIRKEGKNYVW